MSIQALINRNGVSLLEAVIFGTVTAALMLSFNKVFSGSTNALLKAPSKLNMLSLETAADRFAADLQEVDASSFVWAAIPPSAGAPFDRLDVRRSRFNVTDPSAPVMTDVAFQIEPTGGSKGRLIRIESEVATAVSSRTVMAVGLELPDVQNPLVQRDTQAQSIVMITLLYQPTPRDPLKRIIRRVAVKG